MINYIVRNSHVSIYTFNLIWGMIIMMIDYSTFIVKKKIASRNGSIKWKICITIMIYSTKCYPYLSGNTYF